MKYSGSITSGVKRMMVVSVLLLGCSHTIYSQKYDSLTTTQEADIKKVATTTLDELRNLLNALCGPDDGDKKAIVSSHYAGGDNSAFLNKQTPIESDLPSFNYRQSVAIEDYADNFNQAIPAGMGTTVDFTIDNFSPILQVGGQKPTLRIFYHETFKGTSVYDEKLKNIPRVVEMNITKTQSSWETHIVGVTFYNPSKTYDNSNAIPIVKSGSDKMTVPTNIYAGNDAYNTNLLNKGDAAAAANNYAEAYSYYAEAAESSTTSIKTDAGKRITELRSKMGNANYQEIWYDGLKKKADKLNRSHKYKDARKYYYYASSNTANSEAVGNLIQEMENKIALQQGLEDLYNQQAYDKAAEGYKSAIQNDPANSDLYIGLAKCYGKLPGHRKEALNNFNKAIELDNTSANAYFSKGQFLSNYHPKNTDDFTDEAIEAMKAGLGYAPDFAPYLGEWNLELGMLYHRKGHDYYSQAMKCYKICIDGDQRTRTQALRKRAQCLAYYQKYSEALEDLANIKTKIGTDYRDMGTIYVKLDKCDSAKKCFENSRLDDAIVRFGKAEAEYLCERKGDKYMPLFASAFSKGVPDRWLENDPIIRELEQNNAEFRKMRKKK